MYRCKTFVNNEPSDWMTELRDSALRADAQTKMGALFSDVQRCSETGTKFRTDQFVFRWHRMQHRQLTVLYHDIVLSTLHTKSPSNLPVTFMETEFDGSIRNQSTHLRKHA